MSNFTILERLGLVTPKDLYVFVRGDQFWRYASNGKNVTPPSGIVYTAAQITHDTIEHKDEIGPTRIKVRMSVDLPVVQELKKVSTYPCYLAIHRWQTGNPDAPTRLAFGRLSMVSFDGVSCEVELATTETMFEQDIPTSLLQRQCPWSTYTPECGLNPDDWAFATSVVSVDRNTVVVTSVDSNPDGWYTNGILIHGVEQFHVSTQIGTTIKLFGIPGDLAASDEVVLLAGDDFQYGTCATKFNHINDGNGLGFFGFNWIPNKNPLVHTTHSV